MFFKSDSLFAWRHLMKFIIGLAAVVAGFFHEISLYFGIRKYLAPICQDSFFIDFGVSSSNNCLKDETCDYKVKKVGKQVFAHLVLHHRVQDLTFAN